jgi:hypothetical protein
LAAFELIQDRRAQDFYGLLQMQKHKSCIDEAEAGLMAAIRTIPDAVEVKLGMLVWAKLHR